MSKYDQEYSKAYYSRPDIQAKRKAYVQLPEVKEKKKKYTEEYAQRPRSRFRQGKFAAERRNIEWKLTYDEYTSFLTRPCHYCGKQLNPTGCGLDRKNDEPYYETGNVVACCLRCNSTFIKISKYEHKLILAKAIREIDSLGIDTQ